MKLPLVRLFFLGFLFLGYQLLLPAQECLDHRNEMTTGRVSNMPAPYFFQSPTDGSMLLATNVRQLDNSRLVQLFDKDLREIRGWRFSIDRDGEIADVQACASGGYLGVINTPSIENRNSFYSVFLVENASSPDSNIVYSSDNSSSSMEVENILSVEDSILFLSGTKFGEFGVVADSTFIEKQVNNQTVWRHIYRGGVLLGLDGNADKINLLVARDSNIEVVTMSGETGEKGNSYFISLAGYRFAPLIFRDAEQNFTYLARFTNDYELSRYSSDGLDWTYHKVQTLTSNWIDRIADIQFDGEGFIYVNGVFYNEENSSGVLLTKLSPEGEFIWEKRYDNEGELWAASPHSFVFKNVIYLVGEKGNQLGAWNQFVIAFSLDDGELLKECSILEAGDHRFSSRGITYYEGKVYTLGVLNDRISPVLSLRSFNFSDITSSNEPASSSSRINIKVYPNPADQGGHISVEIPLPHQLSRIQVSSVEGRELASFKLSTNQSLVKIADLPAGTYVVYAQDQVGKVVAEQRVVVR